MGRYKKYLTIMLIFSIHMIPFNLAFAGAAEKWEYDVIPDQSQTLKVKGHKVDHLGAAVNDYEYNTKIDPKTAANRTKMGNVGMGRLLKVTGWGLLGSAALQALLESVDWILDPETQSIWRNKKSDPNYSCSYLSTSYDGSKKIKEFYSLDSKSFCPYTIALKRLEDRLKTVSYPTGTKLKFLKWDPLLTPNSTSFRFIFTVDRPNSTTTTEEFLNVPYSEVPYNPPSAEKEVLTPEALADYANHTHPDYSNPELAPKLEPKYSPEIQTDLWKPSNEWEDANSPTVQEVKKKLDEAPPEPKTDPEVTPNPDTGGLKIPPFCTYAAPVCEFIKWVKEEPTNEDNELDIDKNIEEAPVTKINFSTSCPAKIPLVFSWNGGTLDFSFDFTIWCNAISTYVYPIVVTLGSLHALYIVTGVRQNG
jgi:hypothetical protein